MLALGEPRELLLLHFALQAPSLRKLALPLAAHTFAFGVVVLLGVGELLFVVRLRLPALIGLESVTMIVYSKYGCCSLTSAGFCSCFFWTVCGGFRCMTGRALRPRPARAAASPASTGVIFRSMNFSAWFASSMYGKRICTTRLPCLR